MAGRNGRGRRNLSGIVAALVLATALFCSRVSWLDKNSDGSGIPDATDTGLGFDLPDWLWGILDIFLEEDSPASTVNPPADGDLLEVHFIDVGQAESILIKGPQANVLIDAGENNQGRDVIRYLEGEGVRTLHYVIGTHPHSDHIGGLDTVIEGMTVENVILPIIPDEIVPTSQTYTDLLFAIGEKGLQITPAKPGKSYDLGGGALLTILGPVTDYADLNDMSVVSRLTYGDNAFLFTGDATTYAENGILDAGSSVRADVLNLGHHGSSTSTSSRFLDTVSPSIAVISCGIDNTYGHPHREVMELLQSKKLQILRTDLDGTVVVSSDGTTLSVSTAK